MDICDFGNKEGHKFIAEVLGLHMVGKKVRRFCNGGEKGKEGFRIVMIRVD